MLFIVRRTGKGLLTEGATASFTAIMAVCTASTKTTSHRHAQRPGTRPTNTVRAQGGVDSANHLCKLCLHVGRSGPVYCAAWATSSSADRWQGREGHHSGGALGREGGQRQRGGRCSSSRRRGGGRRYSSSSSRTGVGRRCSSSSSSNSSRTGVGRRYSSSRRGGGSVLGHGG
jgi:hypothetical protein